MTDQMTPQQIRTSARRLLKLAAFLEKLPRERFDYRQWVGADWQGAPDLSCGTTACALGWATTIPTFRRLGLRLASAAPWRGSSLGYVVTGDRPTACGSVAETARESFRAAARVFLLDDEEVRFLFAPREGQNDHFRGDFAPWSAATPKQVAAHIRRFVAKHRAVKSATERA